MQQNPAPYRPYAGGYVSEFDLFMHQFLDQHPEVEVDQHRGWDIWWDHRIDPDKQTRERLDHVPVKPYHYE